MNDILTAAAYICCRYEREFGGKIDEMKLHKMMYFAQRESLIRQDKPLFEGDFRGGKYGPVLEELRVPFRDGSLMASRPQLAEAGFLAVMDAVFEAYAGMDQFSLARLTQGETSWRKSRKGVPPAQNSDRSMALEDIRQDALRIQERRKLLKNLEMTE